MQLHNLAVVPGRVQRHVGEKKADGVGFADAARALEFPPAVLCSPINLLGASSLHDALVEEELVSVHVLEVAMGARLSVDQPAELFAFTFDGDRPTGAIIDRCRALRPRPTQQRFKWDVFIFHWTVLSRIGKPRLDPSPFCRKVSLGDWLFGPSSIFDLLWDGWRLHSDRRHLPFAVNVACDGAGYHRGRMRGRRGASPCRCRENNASRMRKASLHLTVTVHPRPAPSRLYWLN